MNKKKLLLLSSSRVQTTGYLEHAKALIKSHLTSDGDNITELLFIPFAGVSIDYDDYTSMVQAALNDLNIKVVGIHQCACAKAAIASAQAIAVGGGNTFHLLDQLYQQDLLKLIHDKVAQGTPYIGWSAGSNIAGISIKTTNDMPIVEPQSFNALNLLNLQLNPHYTDHNPSGHNGETRAQRLAEFMVLNPTIAIIALMEGTALSLNNNTLSLLVTAQTNDLGFVFKKGQKTEINSASDLSYLYQSH